MIPGDGKLPGGRNDPDQNAAEQKQHLNHTYTTDAQPILGLGGQASAPPYSTGQGIAPRVQIDNIAEPSTGKQPVYHVKVTAKPIKNLQPGKKLNYRLTAGPTGSVTSGRTEQQAVSRNTVHCIPEIDGEPLADVDGPIDLNVQSQQPAALKKSSSHLDMAGLEGTQINAVVHAYKGNSALRPDQAMAGLISDVNVAGKESAAAPSAQNSGAAGSEPWWNASSRTLDALTAEEKAKFAQEYQDMTQWRELKYGRSSSLATEQVPTGEGLSSKAYTTAEGKTYSKVIPGLVQSADEEKQTVYNWIVPDENAASIYKHLDSTMTQPGALERELDQVDFQRGNTQNILRMVEKTRNADEPTRFSLKKLFGFGKNDDVKAHVPGGSTRDVKGTDTPPTGTPPLHFQDSSHLVQFLNKANEGMLWEQDGASALARQRRKESSATAHSSVKRGSEKYTDLQGNDLQDARGCCDGGNSEDEDYDEMEPPVKPSIVYGGVEHDAPRYAGQLGPLTMRLHATEFHQYVKVAGMSEPWFMVSRADPRVHAIHGPVPLPWDPKYTGMPAPTLTSLRRHGYAAVDIAPAVCSWFDPELPLSYMQEDEATPAQ